MTIEESAHTHTRERVAVEDKPWTQASNELMGRKADEDRSTATRRASGGPKAVSQVPRLAAVVVRARLELAHGDVGTDAAIHGRLLHRR